MADIKRLKKGLDIPLSGALTEKVTVDTTGKMFAIVPDDYPGLKWRLAVAAGDKVEKGSPILTDKAESGITIVSPVAGTVKEVVRGDRRKIERIVMEREGDLQAPLNVDFSTSESTRNTLLASGLWALLRQRPYDIVPKADAQFRDIFVTAFDSAPLAPEIIPANCQDDLDEGLRILSTLTDGKVYLGTRFGAGISAKYAEVTEYQGHHPAGNVGVQVAATRPVNKGETVLALDARTAVRIGRLSRNGELDTDAEVAVTGPEIDTPQTVITKIGASVDDLVKGNLRRNPDELRIISGNVLTGHRVHLSYGFLRFPYRQVTVILEGDKADEFMGWASMNPKKFSVKRTFPAFLRGLKKPFDFDSRIKGGHRAMILSGEYDKVFPFDIYPEYLLKAIIAKDIDRMEQLGIYEVAPEDFALPEFVDTSKIPLQQVVREGLDYLRSETE